MGIPPFEQRSPITIPLPATFFCQRDEAHFFGWLQEIEGVQSVQGHANELTIHLAALSFQTQHCGI